MSMRRGRWQIKRMELIGICIILTFGVIVYINSIALEQHNYIPIVQFYRNEHKNDLVSVSNTVLSGGSVNLPKVIDYDYKFIMNASFLCEKGDVRLLIFIMSSASNFHLRHVIRHTMIKDVYRRHGKGIKFAFLLGYSQRDSHIIENEDAVFKDVIQENFIDSHRNDTLKVIMAYDWIKKYCNSAEDIVIMRDDVLLNIDMLTQYLYIQKIERTKYLYSGVLISTGVPNRELFEERYLTFSEYPYDMFPAFIHRSFILQNRKCVQKFQSIFPYVNYFHLHDVYLGIIAFKLGILPMHNDFIRSTVSVVASNHSMMALAERLSDNPDTYFKLYVSIAKLDGREV